MRSVYLLCPSCRSLRGRWIWGGTWQHLVLVKVNHCGIGLDISYLVNIWPIRVLSIDLSQLLPTLPLSFCSPIEPCIKECLLLHSLTFLLFLILVIFGLVVDRNQFISIIFPSMVIVIWAELLCLWAFSRCLVDSVGCLSQFRLQTSFIGIQNTWLECVSEHQLIVFILNLRIQLHEMLLI